MRQQKEAISLLNGLKPDCVHELSPSDHIVSVTGDVSLCFVPPHKEITPSEVSLTFFPNKSMLKSYLELLIVLCKTVKIFENNDKNRFKIQVEYVLCGIRRGSLAATLEGGSINLIYFFVIKLAAFRFFFIPSATMACSLGRCMTRR